MSVATPVRRAARRGAVLLAGLLALAAVAGWTWSAFTATTANGANALAAGTVALSDDDAAVSAFAVTGLQPGDAGEACVEVLYTGSLGAAVTLAASARSGALAPYLELTVAEGRGGSSADCAGFVPEALATVSRVADFPTTWATGAGLFAPPGAGERRTYRIRYEVDPAAPDSVQGEQAEISLRWEARNVEHGALASAGAGANGALGTGATADRGALAAIGSDERWRAVAAGAAHSCAIAAAGGLWCWGLPMGVGVPGAPDTSAPLPVGSDDDWTHVALGGSTSCGLRGAGTLWCWGGVPDAWDGENGYGATVAAPTQVGTDADWAQLALGFAHACGVKATGTLWCWGGNGSGQLGLGDGAPRSAPTQVGAATDWESVSAGGFTTCATRRDGALWCWGAGGTGQLGQNSSADADEPVRVGSAADWLQVAVGEQHACAVRRTGTLWCWGDNASGTLGQGDTTSRGVPTRVGGDADWAGVAANFAVSCALRQDRTLECWGSSVVASGTSWIAGASPAPQPGRHRAVALGGEHGLALTWPGP